MLDLSSDFLKPVVQSWMEKIQAAKKAKKGFNETADTCMQFFAGAVGWMYENEYRRKYTKQNFAPRFRVTLNKAFELVAVVGPTLYHRNPVRSCKPYPPVMFGAEAFGDPNDPQTQAIFQQMMMSEQLRYARSKTRCSLYETYASYTPREQPGGGLEQAATDAITEALIKGGAVLWPQCYTSPSGERKLTGCFYDTIDNLLIDPDAKTMETARFIVQRCQAPHWQLEKSRKLPAGSLKKFATDQLKDVGVAADAERAASEGEGKIRCFDQVTYYKIWSKAGVHRLRGSEKGVSVSAGLGRSFDETVGDYAYLEIVQDCPWPLNAHIDALRASDDEGIKKMFSWPVPYWLDDRLYDGASLGHWPMSMLTFYKKPNELWPIAPMAPGISELTIMNILMSAIVNRVWNGSKTFIAVLKAAAAQVKAELKRGEDLVVFELDQIHQSLEKVISSFTAPEMSGSMWELMDRLSAMFDKRVGLSDFLYGMNTGAVSRSAEDVQAKRDAVGVRIGDMAKAVEKWLGDQASMEKICAYWSGVSGKDVLPLLGQAGSYLWDQLIVNEEPDVVFREMYCTVESGTARRPNKDRDIANMNQLFPTLLTQVSGYAAQTGDSEPLNTLVQQMGKTLEQPLEDIKFGPWVPFQVRLQQQQQEQDAQQQQPGPTPEQAQAQAAQEHQQDLMMKQQDMQMRQQEHDQKMENEEEMAATKLKIAEAMLRMKRLQATAAAKKKSNP